MADESMPKGKIIIPIAKDESAQVGASVKRLQVDSMRTQEELTPLASRIIENLPLMHRFRKVIGSDNEDEARDVVSEVTRYAQSLDPSITGPEGTRIVLLLMKMVGRPKHGECK